MTKHCFGGVVAGILLFGSCAAAPAPESRAIPGDIAGAVHAGRTNTPEEYALIGELGIHWVLNTFYWNSIEPAQGQWDFSSYDVFVDTAKAEGKKVLVVLGYDVPWIHRDGKQHNYIPPDKVPLFLAYVRETVGRYRGKVDAWCVWNEPNYIFWKGSDKEFFALAKAAAAAVREADPAGEAVLLSGAFNRGIFGLQKGFIRGMFEAGAFDLVDAVAFHAYDLNPAGSAALYDAFKKIAADYGFGEKIWITEVGYPTGGWYPTKVAAKRFPEYVVKTFVLLAVRGPHTLFWYQLFDTEHRELGNSEDYFGLVRSRSDYTSKAAEAYKLCAAYLAGAVYAPDALRREELPSGIQSFMFKGGKGENTLVLWKDGLASQTLRLRLAGGGGMLHDPITGDAAPLGTVSSITLGRTPVFITWQGSGEASLTRR